MIYERAPRRTVRWILAATAVLLAAAAGTVVGTPSGAADSPAADSPAGGTQAPGGPTKSRGAAPGAAVAAPDPAAGARRIEALLLGESTDRRGRAHGEDYVPESPSVDTAEPAAAGDGRAVGDAVVVARVEAAGGNSIWVLRVGTIGRLVRVSDPQRGRPEGANESTKRLVPSPEGYVLELGDEVYRVSEEPWRRYGGEDVDK